ncbi:MAG TPA: nucleotidyltransferase family protein [Smithellaceae bacterium]|nr:nucleotidyltransferase family protein [Smithellaceae bacterium]
MKKEEILERLRREKPRLFKKYPLHRLALFGSYARDEQTQISDVDIMADVEPTIGLKFVSLAEELEEILNCKVDLVSSRAIKSSLMQNIERELIDA